MANQIIEIALACIISAGGIGGIIVAVVKFSAGQISDRLFEKYRAELDRQTEKYKSELNKKEYVSKTKFDTEFSIYRELMSAFGLMVRDINILIPLGLTHVPNDEQKRIELENKQYFTAAKSTLDAQNTLLPNVAFIPKEFCDAHYEVLGLARAQLGAYERRFDVNYFVEDKNTFSIDDYRRTKELNEKWDALTGKIRSYLASLDVID